METFPANYLVLPGDDVTDVIQKVMGEEKFVVGPGLRRKEKICTAVKSGILRYKKRPDVFWVDSFQRRYVPINGERVVGTVVSKGGFNVRVDIGSNDLASLSLLAFEGATKRNKAEINVGDVVFARVISPFREMETELVCITSNMKKDGMGVLPSTQPSFVVNIPIHTIRKILSPDCKLLPTLGKKHKFEVAAGMNGRVWVSSKSIESTIFISNAIQECEKFCDEEMNQFCDDILGEFEVNPPKLTKNDSKKRSGRLNQ